MDDDLEFEVSSKKKSSARKGRRAKAEESEDVNDNESTDNFTTQRSPATAKPARRVGGWGNEEEDDADMKGKGKSARRRGDAVDETVNTRFTKFDDDDDGSDNDIPVIPDLEDSTVADSSHQIAIAPSVAVNKVSTYKELDSDLQKAAQFAMLDGEVDLKLLTRYLVAEVDTVEEDKVWHWDHLFTEISSELQTEWDANDPDNLTPPETITA